jgi:hypothetical protein
MRNPPAIKTILSLTEMRENQIYFRGDVLMLQKRFFFPIPRGQDRVDNKRKRQITLADVRKNGTVFSEARRFSPMPAISEPTSWMVWLFFFSYALSCMSKHEHELSASPRGRLRSQGPSHPGSKRLLTCGLHPPAKEAATDVARIKIEEFTNALKRK